MRSRTWLNLALLVIVVALALVAVLKPGEEPPPSRPPLTEIDTEAVERLRIERAEHPAIVLARQDSGWRLQAPRALPADATRVKAVLDIARAETYASYGPEEIDAAEVGLDPAETRLELGDTTVAFGIEHPVNARRYVRLGETVYLIAARHFDAVDRDYTGLVSRDLLPADAVPVALRLPDLQLQRTEQGGWRTDTDKDLSSDALQQLVNAWTGASATRVSEFKGDADQAMKAIEIGIEGRSEPIRFRVIQDKPQMILARPDLGLRYHIGRYTAQRLMEPPKSKASQEPRAPKNPGGEADGAAPPSS